MKRTSAFLPLLFLVLALAGCASGGASPPENPVFFPPPPDAPRLQFLTAFSDSRDIEKGGSFWSDLVGTPPEGVDAIVKPYGVDIHDGRIYVCDTFGGGVEVLDLAKREFRVMQPSGVASFDTPANCTVDPGTGDLYVADTGRGGVMIFDAEGNYRDILEAPEGSRYADVQVDGTELWIADSQGSRIRVFDKATLEEKRSFPEVRAGTRAFLGLPTNLWLTDQRIYATDTGGSRVQVYERDGTYVRTIGRHGDALGEFARPKGVAVDRDGNVYVVDAVFEAVQIFNDAGELLLFFGTRGSTPGSMAIPAKVIVDYDNLEYFEDFVVPGHELKYLVIVTNQYGNAKISVYGFIGGGSDDA